MNFPDKPLVLFDGVCNLCNGAVQFIIKNDKQGKILFASLQSETGQEISSHFGLKTENFDTFVFIENQKPYTRSTGILYLVRYLDGIWKFLYFFIIIPLPIRNFIYNFIARNRYKWFGQKAQCMIPTPDLKARFLL
jgi:predicted DCC family thiol-disulfide oxidoreductase YuxK